MHREPCLCFCVALHVSLFHPVPPPPHTPGHLCRQVTGGKSEDTTTGLQTARVGPLPPPLRPQASQSSALHESLNSSKEKHYPEVFTAVDGPSAQMLKTCPTPHARMCCLPECRQADVTCQIAQLCCIFYIQPVEDKAASNSCTRKTVKNSTLDPEPYRGCCSNETQAAGKRRCTNCSWKTPIYASMTVRLL